MPAVAPDGTVYVIRDIGDDFRLSHSITAHDPDATPAFETISQVQMGFVLHSTPVNPGGLHGQPWIVIDHSRGPTRGNIYVLASTQTGSHLSGSDVMFSRSTDAGKTWSTPRAVSDDFQSGAWHWFGAISVAPNGRLDVTWYDTRHAPDNVISEVYYAFSNDAGETWSENIAVSPPFDPRIGAGKIGDYTHMSSNESYAMLAYAATFNGGHDIFFLRIAHDCNDNGVLDDVEVERGGSDCNANLIPDDCESGWAHDCNRNGIPDVCDIGSAASPDCDLDGEPDECSSSPDCDGDDLLDLCVLRQGLDADCNHNGVPDACDVTSGASEDRDLSGVPDDCELRVPSEYSTIQAALDAAQDDEHVILEDGIHSGPGNVALIMPQKRLVIRSAGGPQRCRIDCAGAGRAFTVSVGCRESRIQGLTILNGHAEEGGAILCTERSRVVIEGCVFHGNTGVQQGGAVYVAPQSDVVVLGCEFAGNQAQRGGALALEASMATVRDCRMIGNTADLGGGIMCQWAAPRIEQCVLSGNSAFVGAGLFVKESTPVIVGCTLYANRAVSFGGGLGVVHAEPVVTNSILSGNTGIRGTDHGERSQVELLSLAAVDVTYTVIQGLEEIAGVGNFDAPAQTLFVDGLGPDGSPGTADDDLRLISGSPAIDCGLNAAVPEGLVLDIGGLPRRIDDPKSDDCWQEGAACGRPPIVDLGPHEYQLPSLALVSSDPPDGAIDARQPADLDGSNPAGWAVIALTFNGDAGTLTAADFEIESSGGAPPAIMAVNATGPTLTVQLDGPIPVGECTTLRYIAGAAAVHLGYLPADVSGDGTSSALDILQLIDGLNGAIGLPVHQCDVDRSGQCGPNDILRTIDLLGGAAVYDPWNGAVLPACP
jgi:hypothetical protein